MPIPAQLWLINATQDFSELGDLCRQAEKAKQLVHILYQAAQAQAVTAAAGLAGDHLRLIETTNDSFQLPLIPLVECDEVIFLPCVGDIPFIQLQREPRLDHADSLQLIVPVPRALDPINNRKEPARWYGWQAKTKWARRILREPCAWKPNGLEMVEALQHSDELPRWHSISLPTACDVVAPVEKPAMNMSSRVLVVISFFKCEEWLHGCLTSMAHQTRPAENIVVIDDCSPSLPVSIVERFPNVTLLSTTRNIGPEKILNNIIRATDYDAYLVQDPDDWSSCDRLELSLRHAEQTGADLVGTQEFALNHAEATLQFSTFPSDVNHATANGSFHSFLHCTGLFSRALVQKIGGFDENLKLAADTDFIMRAWHAGRIVNLPHFCVFHRIRAGSLTTHADTCYTSPARSLESKFIVIRSKRNCEAVRAGRQPTVAVQQKVPVGFVHRLGPKLRLKAGQEESPLGTISDA